MIDRVPCEIGLLRFPRVASFHEFADYERLVEMARADGWTTTLLVLLGGEAGLRCGEMMALEWSDVDVGKRQLCVARSEWKGNITATKGGRARLATRAQVRPGVHVLKHTFCSHLAMRWGPARAIQELAGHQDLATTQR